MAEPIIEQKKEVPAGDHISSTIASLSSFKETEDKYKSQITSLEGEIAKRDEKINKVVDFHKSEMERVKGEHQKEITRLKVAIKNAIISDE